MSSFQNIEYKMKKKQIRTIFLFQFKLDRKASETARDINEAFGPGTTTEHIAQWWFKKFCGSDESLEDDEHSGWPSDVDNDQLRALVEANPCTTVRELASEWDKTYMTISNHFREIGKTKKFDKWMPHELTTTKRNTIIKCHLPFFYATRTTHFSIGLWLAIKSGFFMTTGDAQLSG